MLAIGGHVLAVPTCAIPQLHLATRSSVEFDDQKNRERGEVIETLRLESDEQVLHAGAFQLEHTGGLPGRQ